MPTPRTPRPPYGRTDSGSRIPAVRADSVRPGDSLVERDGCLVEVSAVDMTPGVTVILSFRAFGPSRIGPKTLRSDAMVCVARKAVQP